MTAKADTDTGSGKSKTSTGKNGSLRGRPGGFREEERKKPRRSRKKGMKKLPRGGQTIRTPELDARILEHISDGQTLSSFCRQPGTPATRTVEDWRDEDEVFGTAYARARRIGGALIAERMRDVATTRDSDSKDDVNHRKLVIDTDKWLLARWFPHEYGDRVAVTGAEGAPPIQLSNADAAREVAMLLATAAARKVLAERDDQAKRIEVEILDSEA